MSSCPNNYDKAFTMRTKQYYMYAFVSSFKKLKRNKLFLIIEVI
jgi:hypothetical protein